MYLSVNKTGSYASFKIKQKLKTMQHINLKILFKTNRIAWNLGRI